MRYTYDTCCKEEYDRLHFYILYTTVLASAANCTSQMAFQKLCKNIQKSGV